ncbi:hypothetical protein [Asticcacaulis tiandongensis]|uniref:hypothetical protein n=1 Tax=Asticcacaulis tiandongensis TaxID=2565365 RepID=UPI00112E5440|nr:hypothetical protein [Asticcacaulis tiandongensis]
MSRFKFTSRTLMIMGGALMTAPLILLYVIVGALNDGMSLADPVSGHLDRYELQAEAGLAILLIGAALRGLGMMVPRD